MTSDKTPTYVVIQNKYKAYRKQMRDMWESYNLVSFYMPLIHDGVKSEEIPTLQVPALIEPSTKQYSKTDTFGAIAHLIKKANPRRTLIDAVSTFEDYLGHLVYFVYTDYPGKLLGQDQENLPLAQSVNLLRLIVSSQDREEMLSRLVEEKIRGLFYGNPLDFFTKDKARLGFDGYFNSQCKAEMDVLKEVIARRNILVHNGGRVDRKYLREAGASPFSLGKIVPLPSAYLRGAIALLEGLAAAASTLVLKNVYKTAPRGTLARSWKTFCLHTKQV